MSLARPSLELARSSREYVFFVVACASILTSLAVIQWLQGSRRPEGEWNLVLSIGPATSDDVAETSAGRLARELLSETALARARRQVEAVEPDNRLEAGIQLRKACSVALLESDRPGMLHLRLAYRGGSSNGGALLKALAEQYVRRDVLAPRASVSDRIRAAKSDLQAKRQQYQQVESEVERLSQEADHFRLVVREKASQHAEMSRQLDAHTQAVQTAVRAARQTEDRESARLERHLADLHIHRQELLNQFTPYHPLVRNLNHRIGEISVSLEQLRSTGSSTSVIVAAHAEGSLEGIRDAAQSAESSLREQADQLQARETERDRQSARLVELRDEVGRLEAELKDAEAEFERLRTAEFAISEVVAPATPSLPARGPAGLLFSLVLGCTLGSVVAVRARPTAPRLQNPSEIEAILALPVVGLVASAGDSPIPLPQSVPGLVRRIRLAAESILTLFLLATAVAAATSDEFLHRLSSQPLSAAADSLRVLAQRSLL